MKNYQTLARAVGARLRCIASNNAEWQSKWTEQIETILEDFPSGSGFDTGTKIDLDASTGEKLVFTTAFHHMNESGMYDGWTEHVITVTGSLELGCKMVISGRDRNAIKEYISEMFSQILDQETKEQSLTPLRG